MAPPTKSRRQDSTAAPSLHGYLLARFVGIVLFSFVVFAGSAYLIVVRPAQDDLARVAMENAADGVEKQIRAQAIQVERLVRSLRDWVSGGSTDVTDPGEFVRMAIATLRNRPLMLNVVLAGDDGGAIVVAKDGGGFVARVTIPGIRRQHWIRYDAAGTRVDSEYVERDYDPRTRPWFVGATGLIDEGAVFWTDAYTFFETQRAGITASTAWRDPATGSRRAIGVDYTLVELSVITSNVRVGQSGSVSVLSTDGRLIMLPYDVVPRTGLDLDALLLRSPLEAGLPVVAAAWAQWLADSRPDGRSFLVRSGGETWVARFHSLEMRTQRMVIATVAPIREFIIGSAWDAAAIAAMMLSALALAYLVAQRFSHRFTRIMRALVAESERIGAMQLDAPVEVEPHTREVNTLIAAQERMRVMLLTKTRAQELLLQENLAITDELLRHRDTLQSEVDNRTAELREERDRSDQQRQYFEAIVRHAPVGIMTVTSEGRITEANAAFCGFIGYSAEEVASLTLKDLTAPEEWPETLQRLQRMKSGGAEVVNFEKAYVTRGGRRRWADVFTAPVRDSDGAITRFATVVVDIEEWKETEAAIKALFEASSDPYFYVENGRYVMCNAAAARAYGYDDPKDMIGLTPADLAAPMQEDGQPFQATDVNSLSAGRTVALRALARRRDGSVFPIEVSIIPLDIMGRRQTINIVHDLTQERQVQDALRRAAEAAEEATRTKSAFLATMSHEIRTPMNGIVGTLELLEQTELNAEQVDSVGTIRDSAQALLTVIDDILDFSKIEAGRLRIESVSCDLGALVESTTRLFLRTADAKGLTLRCFVDPALGESFLIDPVRLRQVLSNLISNAVKFTSQGGVTVVAEAGPPREGGTTLRLRVIDTGIGISVEAQQRLFQPFMQADESTTRRYGGTGLGLSICLRLIELMGGAITVGSRQGAGTTMSVTLPLTPAPEAAPRETPSGGEGLRVAIVDPDPLQRDFFARWLQDWGASVDQFRAPEEARGGGAGQRYDVYVATPEACTALRSLPADAQGAPRFVLHRPEERPATFEPGGDTVMTSSLTRVGLVTGVAVAAGRKSPEVRLSNWADEKLATREPPTREEAVRQGRLVLLAEDHPVNRSVITRQLRRIGIAADAVENGVEALAALASGAYGLLLSDCNMPEMDGFALTAAVRAQEQGTARHLPIVALTANAMRGEAERCLAAGMDDYLSKPVGMKVLLACLEKWLPPAPEAPADTIGAVDEMAGAIDEAVLREVVGDDPEIIAETLRDYRASLDEDLADVRRAIAARDAAAATEAAHRMKGAARIVGAMALAEACAAVEGAARVGDWASIGGGATTIETAAERVHAVIAAGAVGLKTAAA